MNTSIIRHRVADFIKQHPPFDALPEPDLLELAGSGRVKFHESEEFVYRRGDVRGKFIWILQQGTVHLLQGDPEQGRLHDVIEAGDLLGLDFFAGDGPYLYSARTATDVILYALDGGVMAAMVARHHSVQQFLAAHFAVTTPNASGRRSWLDREGPPEEFLRARVAGAGTPALDVSRALTARPGIGTREAVGAMLSARAGEIAITGDGTRASPVCAVLNASDLALFCGQNPMLLQRELLASESPAEVRPLLALSDRMVASALAQPYDVDDCARMGSALTAAAAETCVRRSSEAARAGVARGWLSFGSLARGEMLRASSPSIAAVYDDELASDRHGAGDAACAQWLDECGLGSGLQTGRSFSEWQRLYQETAADPLAFDLFARREFFDVSLLWGDPTLVGQLSATLADAIGAGSLLVGLLANDTLEHLPPLTFYRGLVLELDGQESAGLDLVRTALEPVTDAARVFGLSQHSLSVASTLDRLESAASLFPQHDRVLREAADAFRIALYQQTLAGVPVIQPSTLSRYEQRLLKTAFSSVLRLLDLTRSLFVGAI